ncbi:FAD-binding oxidoreductase [Maribacter sp. 2307ULW6-5]|uniref:FAD-binding oxidoreductase n=1 Tax=Maribacter sp. 2307ULW6-5 TaxID=3386275 RepID=UPI0039BC56B0
MSDFHALTIASIDRLTPKSVAISFDLPETLKDTFAYVAGQYITLKATIKGMEVRRAYSISSAPASGKLTVGIKKVEDGLFSAYANDVLKPGDTLDVMPPEGRFTFEKGAGAKTVGAFAAGSGITPIMSIAHTVLEDDDNSTFVLVYGNQNPAETMYRDELLALQSQYPQRFFVQWLYSRANEPDCLFGRIERSTVNLVTKNRYKHLDFDAFYLCGPETMINTVSDTLKENGIAEDRIHFELFTAAAPTPEAGAVLDGKTQIQVVVDDEEFSFTMDQKMLVLDAVLKENIDAPYSCQGGVCSSCIARVTEGSAEMVKNQILTDGEIEEGLILTCQAHAKSPTLKIDYDDV